MGGNVNDECLNVDPSIGCPVEASIYGYYPSLGANYFFLVIFAICLILNLVAGIRWRTWTYMIALGFGCFGEAIGYVGRIMLHHNPFDGNGFDIQICCLIIAPAFLAAGVYLTLKYLVLTIGRDYSRIRPKYYTWIFILCDLLSLVLQGAGGGIAATANTNTSQDIGNDLMMAGIAWQVLTLLVFGILVADYCLRAYKNRASFTPATVALLRSRNFRLFAGAVTLAYFAIFTRCVFRIAEMANGWANSIMQDETDFIVLDGVMCTIAALCLTCFHPGYFFTPMQTYKKSKKAGLPLYASEKTEGNDNGLESPPTSDPYAERV